MKSIKYLLLMVACFCLSRVEAQGVNLRLDSNFIGLPSTVHLNDTVTVTIMIANDSTTAFNGRVSIGYSVNGTASVADTSTNALFSPNDTATIAAQSFILRSLIIHVIPPFTIGSSGVVIWPIVTSTTNPRFVISDTLSTTVTVLHPVGIDEITERQIKIYMNGQQLIIENNGNYQLKNVGIYDIAGTLLQQNSISTSGAVNMSEYAAGVYFAEIHFADDTRAIVKIVNTK